MNGLVCVVGSLNDDTTLRVGELPAPGETTLTTGPRRESPGGKGANQAAAAASLGARVAMVGAVGADDAGQRSLGALEDMGVDVEQVARRDDVGTGIALITVEGSGENTIVVDAGANASLTATEVREAVDRLAPAAVLTQLEVPLDAVDAALRTSVGALTVLNPAPMPADAAAVRALLSLVDVLVPNRGELGQLAGRPTPTTQAEIAACVRELDVAGSVVVTLGEQGSLCFEKGAEPLAVPGEQVDTVDASGAGDVFCGCLAAELVAGASLPDAVRRANTMAAASTTRHGARFVD